MLRKALLGYCSPWSVQAGRTLELMISAGEEHPYQLDFCRVICGLADEGGPGMDLRPVASPIDGHFEGYPQETDVGSRACIDMQGLPDAAILGELTLLLWPTAIGVEQTLLHWRSPRTGAGLELTLLADGRVRALLADDLQQTTVISSRPLRQRGWQHISLQATEACMLLEIAEAGGVRLSLDSVPGFRLHCPRDATLVMAARRHTESRHDRHFNGKLEAVHLRDADGATLARWDFSLDISSARVTDVGPHALHGCTVNLPARAVSGASWSGEFHDWRSAPGQYAAIHFHDDDLYDAGWAPCHRLQIPADWASGYYVARLRDDRETTCLPFFVTPIAGKPGAALAVIASTATSIAYANYQFHMRAPDNELVLGRLPVLKAEDICLLETPAAGLSTYDRHSDGSGVRYSSRLRPILNMGPGTDVWNLNADTLFYSWLDRLGIAFDIITDEDLHQQGPELLAPYRAVAALSHPEYLSTPMHNAFTGYLHQGGRLLYLGGNGFYWRIGCSSEYPGAIEVRRTETGARYWAEEPGEGFMSFTGEYGGLWRRLGRPPNELTGIGMRAIGFDGVGHYRFGPDRHNPRVAFLLEGLDTVTTFGQDGLLGSAAGEELDAIDYQLGTPEHTLVIASSEGHSASMQATPEDILMPHQANNGLYDPNLRADVTFFETVAGGAVFAAGSMTWTASLFADTTVAKLTRNALFRFLQADNFEIPDGTEPS